jgi:serine protease
MFKSTSLSYTRLLALFFALLLAACGSGGTGAGGDAPTFAVDPTLEPHVSEIEFIDEPGIRRVGCIVDEDGRQADFVEDEVIVSVEDREELSEIAERLNGTVLFEVDPNAPGLLEDRAPVFALLRVDAPETSDEELAELSIGRAEGAGHLRLCSRRARNTLAAIARESAEEGTLVAANFLLRSDEMGNRLASESGATTGGGPAFGAGYSSNAFDLPYMNRGSEQDIGTAEAARMVHEVVGTATGRNRVDLMIIDGGFLRLDDYPDAEIIPRGRFSRANPMNSCSGGGDCPWHGTNVASAALGTFNDGVGAAGPAGPAQLDDSEDETSFVNPIFVQTPRPNFWDILEFVFRRVPEVFARYPDIANLSFSADVPAGACLLGACTALDELGRWIERAGILVFASAGNDGADVDSE